MRQYPDFQVREWFCSELIETWALYGILKALLSKSLSNVGLPFITSHQASCISFYLWVKGKGLVLVDTSNNLINWSPSQNFEIIFFGNSLVKFISSIDFSWEYGYVIRFQKEVLYAQPELFNCPLQFVCFSGSQCGGALCILLEEISPMCSILFLPLRSISESKCQPFMERTLG